MNRTICRILVVSSLVAVLMAHRAMAQQGQISVNNNGVQQNYVLGPDGTYRVHDDGSLEQVDPATDPALQGLSIPNWASNTPNGVGNNAGGPNIAPGNGAARGGLAQTAQQMAQRIRQATEDSIRKSVGSSDPDWAVLLPMIRKIQALQSAVMPGSRLKAPTGDADMPPSVAQLGSRVQDFQKLLAIDNVPAAQLAQGMASVREARNNVKADLVQARKALTDVVSQRQEAILLNMGVLAD